MNSQATQAGYVAVTCFLLFTVVGACAQVIKLVQRTRAWRNDKLDRDRICDGLHPVREMWSFSAFLLFALSGLTRSYLDYFLLLSRVPVLILSTVILWFLQHHHPQSRKFFFCALIGDLAFLILTALAISGLSFEGTWIPVIVDGALSVVSLLLFYGKQLQAFTMYREKRSHAVSWLRESGLVVKDLTGLWYSISVGGELLWISVTHTLSAISSLTICIVKYYNEHKAESF